MWKLNKSIARESLPTHPVDITIEPWWGVCLVNFTIEEFKVTSHLYYNVYILGALTKYIDMIFKHSK